MSQPPHQRHASFGAPAAMPTAPTMPVPQGGVQIPQPAVQQPGGPAPSGHIPAQNQNITGAADGLFYKIDHRDSNSILSVMLQPNGVIKAKPGAMVTMDGTIQIKGSFKKKISLTAALTGGELSESTFTGPGEVLLAPEIWGDIFGIQIQPDGPQWTIGKGGYLASTQGVTMGHKTQNLKQGLFSGEGLLTHVASGSGVLFVQSLGAIIERKLDSGVDLVVDNGHLVAWTCSYKVERIKAGGFFSGSHTGEGLVCRFTGPGTILIQTRNPESLGQWIASQAPSSGA